ncbi:MAG TPA: aminotransferase class V-fold PLP-dependent enzyme [Clostridiales bacterium]|nr:aminotransferase class V-fold PLP-dependent enzyme [Clostridiales bacterium]
MDIFEKYNLKRIINASGTMTALGASRVSKRISDAMAQILPEFIDMKDLQKVACEIISRLTGAEYGCLTASAAAAITIATAACMTGTDFYRISKLPDTQGLKNEVVIQKGHSINFGSSIAQMISISGAKCIEIGEATSCGSYHLIGAINENTAAALFVVSHHTVQSRLIKLKEFIRISKKKGIPVIVDAASEYDLRGFSEAGADIVIYSGHKFLGGPTSGIIAGKKEMVRACYAQERGIGRGMKIGKESIIGIIEALEQWNERDTEAIRASEDKRIQFAYNFLNNIKRLKCEYSPDQTNNPITRLKVVVDPKISPLTAFELSVLLAEGEPSIRVRSHHVDMGYFYLDPCNLIDGEMEIICDRIKTLMENPINKDYKTENLVDIAVNHLKLW